MQIEWSKTAVACVALVVLGALAWRHIIDGTAVLGIVAVLIPSPAFFGRKEQPK